VTRIGSQKSRQQFYELVLHFCIFEELEDNTSSTADSETESADMSVSTSTSSSVASQRLTGALSLLASEVEVVAVVLLVAPVLQGPLHQLVGRMMFLHLVYMSSLSSLVLKLI